MMTPIAVPATLPGSYGALELKHDYRKNMLLAVFIAAALHLCIVGAILLSASGLTVPIETDIPGDVPHGKVKLKPLPPITPAEPKFVYSRSVEKLTAGIPVPCPDDEVSEAPYFPTKTEWAQYNAQEAQGSPAGEGAAALITSPVVDDWPSPTDVPNVQEFPVTIHYELPVYPEMAELTGQSGTVWIQALVDAEGHVRKANVLKESGSNVGFEEAALKAAFLNVYKPAIQNGRPVPVWISYRVDFKLR